MLLDDLFEANIPISAISATAAKNARGAMIDYVSRLWDEFNAKSPFAGEEYSDAWYSHRDDLADRFSNELFSPEHREDFIKVFLNQPSSALRKIASSLIRNCMVFVNCREYTDDKYKSYGGYFNYWSHVNSYVIKVFVDEQRVEYAVRDIIADTIYGEGIYDAFDHLLTQISSVFVHEYVHLEQELRDPRRPVTNHKDDDLGLVTAGGGRRGNRRDPQGGNTSWARYTGSLKEIEAFASETAIEMLADLGDDPSTERVDNVLSDLASGWGSGKAFQAMNHMRTYWDYFEKAGINPRERDAVWKRYLKLTYQKIWQYRRSKVGKAGEFSFAIDRAPRQWRDWAKDGLVSATKNIAYDVAFNLYSEVDSYNTAERVMANTDLTHKAVSFIQNYFFNEQWDYQESLKTDIAIQRIIARRINELAAQHTRQAA